MWSLGALKIVVKRRPRDVSAAVLAGGAGIAGRPGALRGLGRLRAALPAALPGPEEILATCMQYIYIYIHMYTYVCMYVCMYICMYVPIQIHINSNINICIYVHIHVVYVYLHTVIDTYVQYIHVCVSLYPYSNPLLQVIALYSACIPPLSTLGQFCF